MAELFELHDREKFEITGISFGPDRNDAMRRRLVEAFDHFVDVRTYDDRAVAELIAERKANIAVDLKGYTRDSRAKILAYRPAPVQVNYLGYPGTMGVDFIDYILVDPFVAPPDQQAHFSERLVHLPDCYQVNDSKRNIADYTPSRAEAGLPEKGFVFCCFNKAYKITPQIFDIWMRLLVAVQESVLWLYGDNKTAERNLRQEAESRGVDPERLVFTSHAALPDHLARHRLADIFLDTLPYQCPHHSERRVMGWPAGYHLCR